MATYGIKDVGPGIELLLMPLDTGMVLMQLKDIHAEIKDEDPT